MANTRRRKMRKTRKRGGSKPEWALKINELTDTNASAIIHWFENSGIGDIIEEHGPLQITRKGKVLYFTMQAENEGDITKRGLERWVDTFDERQEDNPVEVNGFETHLTAEIVKRPAITGKRNRHVARME